MIVNVPGLDLGADCKHTSRRTITRVASSTDQQNMGSPARLHLGGR
jgi:hypothetical protein